MSLILNCCRNAPLVPTLSIDISSSSSKPNPKASVSAFLNSSESGIIAGESSRSMNLGVFEIGEVGFGDSVSGSSPESDEELLDDEEHKEHEEGEDGAEFTEERWPCLIAIEESLPIKRGLSNHFSGRSKSFANLSDAKTLSDLVKPENPLNKKRRTLLAWKWRRSFSSYGLSQQEPSEKSMNKQVTKAPCFILQSMD